MKKVIFGVSFVIIFSFFVIKNMKNAISYYITPSELLSGKWNGRIRLGGMADDIKNIGLFYTFKISDFVNSVSVEFQGVPPDLFGKVKGAIVEGYWDNERKVFKAEKIMAKHDETYKPPKIK